MEASSLFQERPNGLLCVIPARQGSKRLPNKHIRRVNGVPLIERAIDRAVAASMFDRIVLTSDCVTCLNTGVERGIDIVYRPAAMCHDYSGLGNAFIHAIEYAQKRWGMFRYACLFEPSAFLVSADYLKRAYRTLTTPLIDKLAHDQPYGAVRSQNLLLPSFYDLRPGACYLEQKVFNYHESLGERVVDIHDESDLEYAELVQNHETTADQS